MRGTALAVREQADTPSTAHPVRPVGRWRVGARHAGVFGWTAVCGLAVMVAGVSARWPRLHTRWRRAVIRVWGRGVATTLGMRTRVTGSPPEAPFLLVSNHLSYLDIILIASHTGCNFVSRHDVRNWPGMGTVARAAGTLFVDRGRKRDAMRTMGDMRRHLDRGIGVTLFPEGTSTRGDQVLPLKSTMLELPARDGIPVHHVTVSYRTPVGAPPAHTLICWWGDMSFGPHFRELCRWPFFEAHLNFGDAPVVNRDRKMLASELGAAITSRFVPVVKDEA